MTSRLAQRQRPSAAATPRAAPVSRARPCTTPSVQRVAQRPVPADDLALTLARAVRARRVTRSPSAVGPVLSRKHGGTVVDELAAADISAWESNVDGDQPAARTAATRLITANRDQFIDLFIYKMNKHSTKQAKSQAYLDSVTDITVKYAAMERALRARDVRATRRLIALLGMLLQFNRDEGLRIIFDNPAEFVEIAVPGLLSSGGETTLLTIVKDRDIMGRLRRDHAARHRALVAMLPLLSFGERASKEAGDEATPRQIVDTLFGLFTTQMSIGYGATALAETHAALFAHGRRPNRDGRLPLTMLDCHHLSIAFRDLIQAHPALEDVRVTGDQVYEALMTVSLSDLPGGLIANTFTGNVFDDAHQPLRRIFFSGAFGMDAHTWSVVDGRAYDPLFGTTGEQVAGAVAARFQRTRNPDVYREIGGDRYIVKHRRWRPAQNPHGFTTGWVLTRDPNRHGIAMETVGSDEADVAESTRRRQARQARGQL